MAEEYRFGPRDPSLARQRSLIRQAGIVPGTRMADPSTNVGAIGADGTTQYTSSGFTPQSNWDSLFKNYVTGETPSSLAAKRNGMAPNTAKTGAEMDMYTQVTPPMDVLANGGVANHAQRWSAPMPKGTGNTAIDAGNGFQTGNPLAILDKYQTPNTTASFNWSKAFNRG